MSADLKYWYLSNHQLFRNLSFSEINGLCILKKFKKSKKSEILDLPYSEKERVYFLKKGTIKLIKINESGEEILIDIIQKNDLFGELNLDDNAENEAFFKVVSDEAIICTFFKENLESVMLQKPVFALNYIKFIGFNVKRIQNSYKNILFKSAKSRLLLLLDEIIMKADILDNQFELPNYLTQKDIAQLICTTRQTIINLFHELESEGLIHYSQKSIILTDIAKFKNLVQNVK